ncbi:MAG: hypothetical protein PHV60_00470 [bacterium]|nr:hypothetical protein [bacterium]
MITIFSIPKPFTGKIDIIQKNAIVSWIKLGPGVQIMLLGNDVGVKEIADKNNLIHLNEVKVNNFGTPFIDSAFNMVRNKAKYSVLVYVNADIILLPDLLDSIREVTHIPQYLMSGRRVDLDLGKSLEYTAGWEEMLLQEIALKGTLHGFSGIDYFVFPKNMLLPVPPFIVGRQGWDNWMLWYAKNHHIPIIDATGSITAVHQNHDYTHSKYGEKDRVGGPEKDYNYKLAGNLFQMLSLREADLVIMRDGLRPPGGIRLIISKLSKTYLWQVLFAFKRRITNYWENKWHK